GKVFEGDVNSEILSLYLRVYLANQRQGTSKVKTRGEVSGGGKKPWRQKGTGRARQGSIRAPHFVHGGIAHGPKPKDWSLKLPSMMRRKALLSALLVKQNLNKLVSIENFSAATSLNTKSFVNALKEMEIDTRKKVLFVTPKYSEGLFKAGRNIKNVSVRNASDLNVYDVLAADSLVLLKGSEEILKGRV
ncbi:50S ribosomal protein L4, partial [candidate division WWE3 bacterium]|nr:50S ribosomal protein L4 [candidate division WWE3 bacterium]